MMPEVERRKCLATMAIGPARWHFRLAREPLERYAQRHGYELHVETRRLAPDRPISWSKVLVLQRLLADHDFVMWVDADAIVVDPSEDLHAWLPRDHFLALALQKSRRRGQPPVPNAGVLGMRGGPLAERFLDEAWRQEDLIDHAWWEQAAMLRLLGWSLDTREHLRETEFSRRTTLLDNRWNSAVFDRAASPIVKHYPAKGTAERVVRMARVRLALR